MSSLRMAVWINVFGKKTFLQSNTLQTPEGHPANPKLLEIESVSIKVLSINHTVKSL